MNKIILQSGIEAIIKTNKNTPRVAIVVYFKLNRQKKSGLYYLMSWLLFQGTKKRTAEALAQELGENAIGITFDVKSDYIRFKILCLNEDLEKALEIFQDMLENSTFEKYAKQALTIKGELEADLDSPKVQAQDEFYRTLYKNHFYGRGTKETIDSIESITKEELIEAFEEIKFYSKKNIFVVGDITTDEVEPLLQRHFSSLKEQEINSEIELIEEIKENRISTVIKEDANQAQIFQGWHVPSNTSKEFPAFILLNTLLGAAGLSSRLFLELREKQGLAYTVRSVYESFGLCGDFYVYIATEPKNIKISLNGFAKEIKKVMTEHISDEELENIKNNAIGKRQFYFETNLSEASARGYYEYLGLGYDFETELVNKIKEITKEDLLNIAEKYFSKASALCVLAPEKYLKEAELI